MISHESFQSRYPHLSRSPHKEPEVFGWGSVHLGGGRFSLAAGPSDPTRQIPEDLAAEMREKGVVFFKIPATLSQEETSRWALAARDQGLAVLLDLTGAPVPLAAEVWEKRLAPVDGVLAGGEHVRSEGFLEALCEKGAGLFFCSGRGGVESWLEAADSLAAIGVLKLVLVLADGTDAHGLPRLELDAVIRIQSNCRFPLMVFPGDAWSAFGEEPFLACAACGAHGLILDSHQSSFDDDLIGDLKTIVPILDREMTRIPKRPEGLARQGAVDFQGHERRFNVAFQGEHGAYSEMAVFNLFPKSTTQALPCKTFRDVFQGVLEGQFDYGVLPFENALAGSINENYDLMVQFPDLHITGETQVRIEHNLIGLPGARIDGIRKVFSHPQGLAQSQQFLDAHPDWERVPFYDTAGSVAHIAVTGDPSWAAIASSEAARVYSMEILQAGIETNHRNFTRFSLIAPLSVGALGEPNKASVLFSTPDSPGALMGCLSILARHGLNMKRLESRPIHGKPWVYMFYVDLEVSPQTQAAFEAGLRELKEAAEDFRILGIYKSI